MRVKYILPDARHFSLGRGGAVSHAIGIVNGLVDAGWDVELICEPSVVKYSDEISNDVRISCVPVGPSTTANRSRVLASAMELLRKRDAEERGAGIVLIRKNLTTLLWSGRIARSVSPSCRLVYEVNGLSFERYSGSAFGTALVRMGTLLNKIGTRRADLVYVVTQQLRDHLCAPPFGLDPQKVVVIPNGGPNPVSLRRHPRSSPSKDAPNALRLLFFGKFQPYNDFETLVEAYKLCLSEGLSVELHFVGFGPEADRVWKLCEGLAGVYHWGEKRLSDLYEEGIVTSNTVGLLPLRLGHGPEDQSPIKLFDYFSLGVPVVYAAIPLLGRQLAENRGAVPYSPGDAQALVSAIRWLSENPEEYDLAADAIRDYYGDHTWGKRMALLGRHLQELVDRH